jgi:hypothetical protein
LQQCRLFFPQAFLPAAVEALVSLARAEAVAELELAVVLPLAEVAEELRAAAPASLRRALARARAQLLFHHHQALRQRC